MNVFEIERYATEDGPGIRTVLFLKACNLRCLWCQNPESQESRPQVMYYQKNCVACEKCLAACPVAAITRIDPYGFITDQETCTLCGACVDICFYDARQIVGREYHIDELLAEILKDRSYYEESGGGVTFSGGEPLLQIDELVELAERLKEEAISIAVETAGYVAWERFERLMPLVDLFFIDFKHPDSEAHRGYTGVPNELILENIGKLSRSHRNVAVRIPVIPGVNSDKKTLERMYRILLEATDIRRVELLPYHRLGSAKYQGLGRPYKMADAVNLSREECEPLAESGRALGLDIRIGAE